VLLLSVPLPLYCPVTASPAWALVLLSLTQLSPLLKSVWLVSQNNNVCCVPVLLLSL